MEVPTLSGLSGQIRSLREQTQRLEQQRVQLIHAEIKAGMTKSQVAYLTGLSRQRVGQIAEEK